MGKLLSRYESFIWSNNTVNRSVTLQNFNSALALARSKSDKTFSPDNIYTDGNTSNIFHLMFSQGMYLYDDIKKHFNWLTVDDYQVLINFPSFIGRSTERQSCVWAEFSEEFSGEHISMIGMEDDSCPDPLIYDIVSHKKFHSDYVAQFNFEQQKENFEYFKEHFVSDLRIDPAQIKEKINKNQVQEGIVRLDDPPYDPAGNIMHGQKIHIHLKVGKYDCALNIDGTWKHSLPKDSDKKISVEICTTLSEWGFRLPDEYYLE